MTHQLKAVFLFAHGAGAGKDSEFMFSMASRLESQQIVVKRFNFPYMSLMTEQGKRRPPDRMPKLIAFFHQQVEHIIADPEYAGYSIFIGGKSMGGRAASLLAESVKSIKAVKGVICLGFPFHPPKSPDKFRGDHLVAIELPTLILQGERDSFGDKQEVSDYSFSCNVSLEFIFDGDHSFEPRKRSGGSYQTNLDRSSELIAAFIERHSS